MIKIEIKNNKTQIKISGHALYADYGKDIVCAGISAILITTINAILKYQKDAIEYNQKDNFNLTVLKEDKIVNLLLNNMLDLFKEMQQTYPKNITIREDEK